MQKTLSVFLGMSLVLALGCKSSVVHPTTQNKQQNASPWKSDGVRFAAFMFADDFENLMEGNESILSEKDLQEISQVGIVSTADDYQRAYDANEIAADNKYHGKKILLRGTVDSINKNAFDQGYLTLRSGALMGMQAQLRPDSTQQAASLSRGSKVLIVCDAGPRVLDVPTATNCQFLSAYLRSLNASPEQQMRDFFSGERPFTRDEFAVMTIAYPLGTSDAIPTSCRVQPSRETCATKYWMKDKLKQLSVSEGMKTDAAAIEDHSRSVPCSSDSTQKCRQLSAN